MIFYYGFKVIKPIALHQPETFERPCRRLPACDTPLMRMREGHVPWVV